MSISITIDAHELLNLAANVLKQIEKAEKEGKCSQVGMETCDSILSNARTKAEESAHLLSALFVRSKSRNKRGINFLGEILHKITGVVDHDGKKKIDDNMKTLKANQDAIADDSKQQKHAIVEVFEEVKQANLMLENVTRAIEEKLQEQYDYRIISTNEIMIIRKLQEAADFFVRKADAVVNLISSKHITGNIITLTRLQDTYDNLKKQSDNPKEHLPFDNIAECIMHQTAEITIVQHLIVAKINIPLTMELEWKLFKIKTPPMVKDGRLLSLHIPGKNYVAVSYSGTTTTLDSIDNCIANFNGTLICPILEPVTHKNDDDCISAAFFQSSALQDACAKFIRAARLSKTLAMRESDNSLWIFPTNKTRLDYKCKDELQMAKYIDSDVVISAQVPCVVEVNTHKFFLIPTIRRSADEHIRTAVDIDWNHEAMVHTLPDLPHISNTHVEEIQHLSTKLKDLNDHQLQLNQINMKDDNTFTLLGSLSVTAIGLVIVGLIIICLCCVYKD